MKASFLDLRRRMQEVLWALERNESVTILYRGKERAVLVAVDRDGREARRTSEHPAFGMWAEREDMRGVEGYVRELNEKRLCRVMHRELPRICSATT